MDLNVTTIEGYISDAFTVAEPYARPVLNGLQTLDKTFTPKSLYIPPALTHGAAALRDVIAKQLHTNNVTVRRVNFHDIYLWTAIIAIFLQPVIWNVIGRLEHSTRIISRVTGRKFGVVLTAAWIFFAGLYRDALFNVAIEHQQVDNDLYGGPLMQLAGFVCITLGAVLVLSSFYQLGFYGTYLGDYFGILMDQKIESFPFNVLDDPMYDGSSLAFFGKAILAKSSAGVILSIWVYIVYRFVSIFEGSFTASVYAKREADRKNAQSEVGSTTESKKDL